MLHKNIFTNVKNIVQQEDFPHIIFYGSSGGGKRTLIKTCINLNSIYGKGANKLKLKIKEFEYVVSSKVECAVISCYYHFNHFI